MREAHEGLGRKDAFIKTLLIFFFVSFSNSLRLLQNEHFFDVYLTSLEFFFA